MYFSIYICMFMYYCDKFSTETQINLWIKNRWRLILLAQRTHLPRWREMAVKGTKHEGWVSHSNPVWQTGSPTVLHCSSFIEKLHKVVHICSIWKVPGNIFNLCPTHCWSVWRYLFIWGWSRKMWKTWRLAAFVNQESIFLNGKLLFNNK